MKLFDCNCCFGPHPNPPFRFARDERQLLAEMDALGIDRATLYNKIRKYQLRKDGEPEFEENELA